MRPAFVKMGTTSLALFSSQHLMLSSVEAFSSYKAKIPNGSTMGAVGHQALNGGNARNAFGNAFAGAGRAWTTSLCQADSDGDGMTNGYELGDPCCVWSQGAADWNGKRTTGLTQPGIANSGADVTTTHGCPAPAPAPAPTPTPTPAPTPTPTPAPTPAPTPTPTPAASSAPTGAPADATSPAAARFGLGLLAGFVGVQSAVLLLW